MFSDKRQQLRVNEKTVRQFQFVENMLYVVCFDCRLDNFMFYITMMVMIDNHLFVGWFPLLQIKSYSTQPIIQLYITTQPVAQEHDTHAFILTNGYYIVQCIFLWWACLQPAALWQIYIKRSQPGEHVSYDQTIMDREVSDLLLGTYS